jgi:hypothetical protein
MQANKTAVAVSIVGCLIFSVQAQCVVITPSNVVLPATAGKIFSFDLVVFDANSTSALAFQATISVSGPGTLTLDANSSIAVKEETKYWAFGNSASATAFGSNPYTFGDNTANGFGELLYRDDIMARYAFEWDGTKGAYTFTLDLDTSKSFVLLPPQPGTAEALQFTPGIYLPGSDRSFTINIPEPSTLVILGLGGMALLKKRRE